MLGGGTLNYRGATYRFRLGGLGIGGVGVSRLDATGSVYNLRSLADFEGVYGQVRSGWAAGDQGRGRSLLDRVVLGKTNALARVLSHKLFSEERVKSAEEPAASVGAESAA